MSRLWTMTDGQRRTHGRNVKIELEFWKQNSQYLKKWWHRGLILLPWPPLCRVTATGMPIDCQWNVTQLSMECQSTVNGVSLNCHQLKFQWHSSDSPVEVECHSNVTGDSSATGLSLDCHLSVTRICLFVFYLFICLFVCSSDITVTFEWQSSSDLTVTGMSFRDTDTLGLG